MNLVDTHAHLDLLGSPNGDLAGVSRAPQDVLERARRAGVAWVLCVGTTLASSRRCVELARRFPGLVYAAAGIHPNHCAEAAEGDFERVAELAALPEVAAVGETGLDYHRDYAPPELQAAWLRRHLALARDLRKPVIIHARKADQDALTVLVEHGAPLPGVRHCYDGGAQVALRYAELGLRIAFGGTLTYPGHSKLKEAAAALPADRLLLETDSPYMTPAGAPDGPNEPANVVHVARSLAQARGCPAEEIARLTTDNAQALFLAGR